MSNLAISGNADFNFSEDFLKEDSPEGIRLLNLWLANHPNFQWSDRDVSQDTVAEALLNHGNVTVLKYVLDKGGDKLLESSDPGYTMFERMISIFAISKNSAPIEKVEECAKILVDAGAVDPTLELAKFHKRLETSKVIPIMRQRMSLYAPSLTKLLLRAGAQWSGSPNATVTNAIKEVLDWDKSRSLYQDGDFRELPMDIIRLIQGQIIIYSEDQQKDEQS